MEGIKPKPLQRAIGKLLGQAVDELEQEEQLRQYERLAKMHAQTQKDQWTQQQLYNNTTWTTTTTAGSTFGQGTSGAISNTTWQPQLGGGLNGPYSSGYAQQAYAPSKLSLTDEQMATLTDKLAVALAKGWECTRCHRIWSPREVGCEFCNFIDRLEGKDVERDSA